MAVCLTCVVCKKSNDHLQLRASKSGTTTSAREDESFVCKHEVRTIEHFRINKTEANVEVKQECVLTCQTPGFFTHCAQLCKHNNRFANRHT